MKALLTDQVCDHCFRIWDFHPVSCPTPSCKRRGVLRHNTDTVWSNLAMMLEQKVKTSQDQAMYNAIDARSQQSDAYIAAVTEGEIGQEPGMAYAHDKERHAEPSQASGGVPTIGAFITLDGDLYTVTTVTDTHYTRDPGERGTHGTDTSQGNIQPLTEPYGAALHTQG